MKQEEPANLISFYWFPYGWKSNSKYLKHYFQTKLRYLASDTNFEYFYREMKFPSILNYYFIFIEALTFLLTNLIQA